MNQLHPKVSVVMGVYNGSQYLSESVESILNQTFKDFEFIILDDGSTDNSWEILTEYAEHDRRIKLFKNEENIGLTKSLNKGLKLAQGEYIARQDADDISLPERLEKQIKFLDEHSEVILVSANYEYIDSTGLSLGKLQLAEDPILTAWYLLFYNRIGAHGLTMFRHKVVSEIGGYAENYRYSQDYELWSRLTRLGKIVILPDYLQLYRRNHSESISVKAKSTQEELALSVTKENIKQLIGETLSLKEIAELKNFWLYQYPNSQQVNLLNSNLKKIYREFSRRRKKQGIYSLQASRHLKQVIGKQFFPWINSLSVKNSLSDKIRVSSCAFAWHPQGVISLWLSKIKKVLLHLIDKLNHKLNIRDTKI